MKLEHEDPRVIDYVLGELPEDERRAVEQALLEDDGENVAFRDEVLALTALAKQALAEEAGSASALPVDAHLIDLDAQRIKRQARSMRALKLAAIVTLVGGIGAAVILPALGRAREAARPSDVLEKMAKADLNELKSSPAQHAAVRDSPQEASTPPASTQSPAPSPVQKKSDFDALPMKTITRQQVLGESAAPPKSEPKSAAAAAPQAEPEKPASTPTPPAHELVNMEVGGGIRIRGDWKDAGGKAAPHESAETEQRTRLSFKADFADNVSTYIPDTEVPNGAQTDLYQAYIEPQESEQEKLELHSEPSLASRDLAKLQENIATGSAMPELVQRSQADAQLRALGYANNEKAFHDSRRVDQLAQSNDQNEAGKAFQPTMPLSFKSVAAEPLSTFAADVDTASYTFVKRMLQGNSLPAPAMVRAEEFINYFDYAYPQPVGEHPFSVTVDIAGCPWAPSHRLARVGIRGKAMDAKERPAANLVFLVDVSGSMDSPDKLPLVRESLKGLLSTLNASDRVGIVTYAGESRVALAPTSCEQKATIAAAIDSLQSGGSTNGADGINTAYELAKQGMVPGGINRVIIATDGDFNVGVTSQEGLLELIQREAKSGVFLSVLGYGMGNLMDSTLEMLADKGNGFYAYISDVAEARRVLVEKGLSAIATIAKDVKFQLEFNPAKVAYYRQVGYENRQLAAQDFNDDTKDAGDIGPGHTVTALYELVPAGQSPTPGVDPLKYQAAKPTPAAVNDSPETMTVKLRYKQPDAQMSKLLEVPVNDAGTAFDAAPQDFRFAAAVAAFAESLKGLQVAAPLAMEQIQTLAESAKGSDPARQDFVDLVVTAKTLRK